VKMSVAIAMLSVMTDDALRRLAGLEWFVSAADLTRAGFSRRQVETLISQRRLTSLAHGIYARTDVVRRVRLLPSGDVVLRAAATLATGGRGTVISHHTAARLHGLDMLDEPTGPVAITRPPGTGSRSGKPGTSLHVARLPAAHIGARFGLRVTTGARTVVDLARNLDVRGGVVVADCALREGLTTKKELEQVLADLRRCRGVTRAADVVQFADRRSESVLESIARVVFREFGLPPPQLQVNLGGDEFIGRADFYWATYLTVAEADGALKYDVRYAAVKQLRRDRLLREAGFEVVHFTWQELIQTPEIVVARVRAAFQRGMEPGATKRRVS
jgi:very-short-patch-repair endonuclease